MKAITGASMKLRQKMYAFAWASGKPYITSILAWTARTVREQIVQQLGKPWPDIRRKGSRIIPVIVSGELKTLAERAPAGGEGDGHAP